MAEKAFEPEDPMELVDVSLPDGSLDEMAACLVEDLIRDGWDDESLLRLFRDPFYRATHQIHRVKGDEYVKTLISALRQKWGYWRGDDIPHRLRLDEVKRRMLKEANSDAGGL